MSGLDFTLCPWIIIRPEIKQIWFEAFPGRACGHFTESAGAVTKAGNVAINNNMIHASTESAACLVKVQLLFLYAQ